MRRAKILATIGPASRDEKVLEEMIKAGLNAVRINMSHGTQEEHAATINLARSVAKRLGTPLAVLVDLSGPKIRTGLLQDAKPLMLESNMPFVITTRDINGSIQEVSTNFKQLPAVVQVGESILLDDGAIELIVTGKNETDVQTRVVNGGVLSERKGINLPNTALPIASMTEKDLVDMQFAVAQNADYIALSFVRKAEDCIEAKAKIKEFGGRAALVAKIEKAEAIANLDAIIRETDGVMVARGDLGVETNAESVPVYQKQIIEKSVQADKFVITATQMLQSMTVSPRPTRAESSDVANAVWDGTDAVMLSAETASGMYPVQSVATMARIIEKAENFRDVGSNDILKRGIPSGRTSQALCKAATIAAEELKILKTAVFTESGLMARRLSSVRPKQRIFALTSSDQVKNELALIWGVEPLCHKDSATTEAMLKEGENTLLEAGLVENQETIVMMAGRLSGLGLSSSIVVWTVGEDVPRR